MRRRTIPTSKDPNAKTLSCTPDANGYNTRQRHLVQADKLFEWCQDHNKPLQATPIGDVPAGGPATLPDPNIFANGAWYSGSPYLGPDATTRATGPNSSVSARQRSGESGQRKGLRVHVALA